MTEMNVLNSSRVYMVINPRTNLSKQAVRAVTSGTGAKWRPTTCVSAVERLQRHQRMAQGVVGLLGHL